MIDKSERWRRPATAAEASADPPTGTSKAQDVAVIVHERLAACRPLRLELTDDSARHAGHAGALGGGGHYRLLVVSAQFTGKSALARHRLVYDTLGDLMQCRIHALSIRALTPEEAQ